MEYALRDTTKPMGVATCRVLPRKLKDEFPTARQKKVSVFREELEERTAGHDEQIAAIFDAIRWLMAPPDTSQKRFGFGWSLPRPGYGVVKEKKASYGTRAHG